MKLRSAAARVPGARWLYRRWWNPEIALAESYDLQTISVMRRVLGPSSCCVDGGAHQGDILRHMIRLAPEGRHFAFEPLPHLAEDLRQRFPGVVVHECALADSAGDSAFQHVENDPGYSGLRRRRYDRPDRIVTEIRVATARLDDLLPRDRRIDLIKLDLEGGEYHALRGGMETLKRCRPFVIFEFGIGAADYYGVTPQMMWDLFVGEAGMVLTTMQRWLDHSSPLGSAEFANSYGHCHDFYFLAHAASATVEPR
jgi:FkbM family methyltransferase